MIAWSFGRKSVDETLKQDVEALRADLKQIKADLVGLTKKLGSLTATEAAEGLDSIKQASAQAEARLRHAATEARTTLEEQVREKPLGTLLLAFAIGMLFGKAAGR
jgi:ElaB/YqjD/DUF883 family membrane-anchored ribosome-binding protein